MYDTLILDLRALLDAEPPLTELQLKTALAAATRLTGAIQLAKAEAHGALIKARYQYRHPKDKEFTDFDRAILLEGMTADVTVIYETISGLEKALSQRIEALVLLLQTLQGNSS
jgi:hypothetical protein